MKLLKFSASWCGPCKMMTQAIKAANLNIEVEEIDTDESPEKAARYGVRSVPTMILVDGDTEIRRKTGTMSISDLQKFIVV